MNLPRTASENSFRCQHSRPRHRLSRSRATSRQSLVLLFQLVALKSPVGQTFLSVPGFSVSKDGQTGMPVLPRRRVKNINPAEPGHRAPMADCVGLSRLAFAIVKAAAHFISRRSTQCVAGVPEIGSARL